MLNLNIFRKNLAGLSDLLNYAGFVEDGVLIGKDGALMASFTFEGPDRQATGLQNFEALTRHVAGVLKQMDERWMFHSDTSGSLSNDYPECEFPDPVTALLDTGRRTRYREEGTHFERQHVMTLSYMPVKGLNAKVEGRLVVEAEGSKHIEGTRQGEMQRFQDGVHAFMQAFSGGAIRVRQLNSHEMFSHVSFCVTGLRQNLVLPSTAMYLDCLLGSKDLVHGLNLRVGEQHVSVVSFVGFPRFSAAGIFERLANFPGVFRWSTRYIPVSQQSGVALLEDYQKDWDRGLVGKGNKVNGDAYLQSQDCDALLTRVRSGDVSVGFWSSCVVLMGTNPAELKTAVAELEKTMGTLDSLVTRKEGFNTLQAYLGSLPGHSVPNVRRPLFTNENVADMLPLSHVWSGFASHPAEFYPEGSPADLWAATEGSTPFRACFNAGTSPHALVLGPSGSGKSTLLGMAAASHFRFHDVLKRKNKRNAAGELLRPKVIAFDKGYSLFVLCKAAGGVHYDLASEHQELGLCPLANIDRSDAEMDWALDWLETLCALQDAPLAASDKGTLRQALQLLAANEPQHRTMSDLCGLLPSGSDMTVALEAYTVTGGAAGKMLDANVDQLTQGDFTVFELEHLMGFSDRQVVPVLLYLFHRIEQLFDGSPVRLILDEAWLMLSHPLFREKIREWLKVLRKANVHVIFATQSVNDIVKSPIADTLVEQCQTRILLANSSATTGASRTAYELMGVPSEHIEVLTGMTPKSHYFFSAPQGNRVMSLGLRKLELAFIGSSGKEDIATARRLIADHGNKWVSAWLTHKGLHEWVPYYEWLSQQQVFSNTPPGSSLEDKKTERKKLRERLRQLEEEITRAI